MSNTNIILGKLQTTNFQMTSGGTTGYVLSSIDNNGNAKWDNLSSLYTGNTSGDCISDFYISNIHSCSPLNINPLDEGNVYFGSTSGVTIDLTNNRVGIGTETPTAKLHINNTTSSNTFLVEDSANPDSTPFVIDSSGNVGIGVTGTTFKLDVNGTTIHRDNVLISNSKEIFWSDTSTTWPTSINNRIRWTLNNDSAQIYAFQPSSDDIDFVFKITDNATTTVDNYVFWMDDNGGESNDRYPLEMNGEQFIVNPLRRYATSPSNSRANRTNFYVLKSGATGVSSSILHANVITNRVGINTSSPSETLDVDGKIKTTNFQMTSGAINGYVLTSDSLGNASWNNASSLFTGNTSATCITDLYISNLYGCSPITVHDNIQSFGSSATGVTSFAFGNNVKAYGNYSHAEGRLTTALGYGSHAEGQETTTSSTASHAEGYQTTAQGNYSHSEGDNTIASGQSSHAEGVQTTAIGTGSHTEGGFTTTSGIYSHAEGYQTTAQGNYSHSEGGQTIASGIYSSASGYYTIASGQGSHAEGKGTTASGTYSSAKGYHTTASGYSSSASGNYSVASGNFSHAEGRNTTSSGYYSHAEGGLTIASGTTAHAEGSNTKAIGDTSHAEGFQTTTNGGAEASHAEGNQTTTIGIGSHSEGLLTIAQGSYSHTEGGGGLASGTYSHAEGRNTYAIGPYSHAEGDVTSSVGNGSHSEGQSTTASGIYSHAEGRQTIASGSYSHSEGFSTTAQGNYSHAEGRLTTASGIYSHAEGRQTIASGSRSHAEGQGTTASSTASHAEGRETTASGIYSHAEGFQTTAFGTGSHAQGNGTDARATYSHAGGLNSRVNTIASVSLVFGDNAVANAANTIVLGQDITGSTANHTYVESLNIQTVGSSAFVNDIRIDANGFLTTNTSDERLKENILPLSGTLETIKLLQGVTYQWKDRSAGGDDVRLGFIAQQVEQIEPKLVFTNKNDEYKGIHIDGIIPLLVEAIKEQQLIIDNLKERIVLLETNK